MSGENNCNNSRATRQSTTVSPNCARMDSIYKDSFTISQEVLPSQNSEENRLIRRQLSRSINCGRNRRHDTNVSLGVRHMDTLKPCGIAQQSSMKNIVFGGGDNNSQDLQPSLPATLVADIGKSDSAERINLRQGDDRNRNRSSEALQYNCSTSSGREMNAVVNRTSTSFSRMMPT